MPIAVFAGIPGRRKDSLAYLPWWDDLFAPSMQKLRTEAGAAAGRKSALPCVTSEGRGVPLCPSPPDAADSDAQLPVGGGARGGERNGACGLSPPTPPQAQQEARRVSPASTRGDPSEVPAFSTGDGSDVSRCQCIGAVADQPEAPGLGGAQVARSGRWEGPADGTGTALGELSCLPGKSFTFLCVRDPSNSPPLPVSPPCALRPVCHSWIPPLANAVPLRQGPRLW